jgi:nucleoid-associated protein YgaU
LKHEIKYGQDKAGGATGSAQKYESIKPRDFTMEFLLDGTGVATEGVVNVGAKVKEFFEVAGSFEGQNHRPKFLKVCWGDLLTKCVLKVAEVTYTLFDLAGKPLRAKIKADFTEAIDEATRVAKEDKKSPDLTHQRIVQAGDTLPLMCFKIYGDAKYYLHVANFNKITHFRRLQMGQEIFFPPIKD